MSMEEVFDFLRENSTFSLAAADLFEGKLYVQTGNGKNPESVSF